MVERIGSAVQFSLVHWELLSQAHKSPTRRTIMDTSGDFYSDVHTQRHWESFEDWRWCVRRVAEMMADGKGNSYKTLVSYDELSDRAPLIFSRRQ